MDCHAARTTCCQRCTTDLMRLVWCLTVAACAGQGARWQAMPWRWHPKMARAKDAQITPRALAQDQPVDRPGARAGGRCRRGHRCGEHVQAIMAWRSTGTTSWSGELTPYDWLCHGIPSAAACAERQAPRAMPALGATLVAPFRHNPSCCSQSTVAMTSACRRLSALQGDCRLTLAQCYTQ